MADLWTRLRAARRQRWAVPSPPPVAHFKAEFPAPTPPRRRPPSKPMTSAQKEVAHRLYYRNSKVRYRCELDHAQTCADRHDLAPIGYSVADGGFVQDLWQCPVCHAIWTTDEAFR